MGGIDSKILYEDQFYVILQDDDRQIITLVMPERRLALEFSFSEWQDLRDIISGIELPFDTDG